MAGSGNTIPKDPSRRRRRNSTTDDTTSLNADGRVRGPRLPEDVLDDGEVWHKRTKAWWDGWRRSAQARTFTATDWDFLLDTALMHHTMWAKGRWEFAAEVRLRVGKFGATPEDRKRLHINIEMPAPKPFDRGASGSNVTDLDERRARLTG